MLKKLIIISGLILSSGLSFGTESESSINAEGEDHEVDDHNAQWKQLNRDQKEIFDQMRQRIQMVVEDDVHGKKKALLLYQYLKAVQQKPQFLKYDEKESHIKNSSQAPVLEKTNAEVLFGISTNSQFASPTKMDTFIVITKYAFIVIISILVGVLGTWWLSDNQNKNEANNNYQRQEVTAN